MLSFSLNMSVCEKERERERERTRTEIAAEGPSCLWVCTAMIELLIKILHTSPTLTCIK